MSEHGGALQIGFALLECSVEFWFPVDGLRTLVTWQARRVCISAYVAAA